MKVLTFYGDILIVHLHREKKNISSKKKKKTWLFREASKQMRVRKAHMFSVDFPKIHSTFPVRFIGALPSSSLLHEKPGDPSALNGGAAYSCLPIIQLQIPLVFSPYSFQSLVENNTKICHEKFSKQLPNL